MTTTPAISLISISAGAAVGGAHVGDDALEMLDEPFMHIVVKRTQRAFQNGASCAMMLQRVPAWNEPTVTTTLSIGGR